MNEAQYRERVKPILEKHYGFVEPRTLEMLVKLWQEDKKIKPKKEKP